MSTAQRKAGLSGNEAQTAPLSAVGNSNECVSFCTVTSMQH